MEEPFARACSAIANWADRAATGTVIALLAAGIGAALSTERSVLVGRALGSVAADWTTAVGQLEGTVHDCSVRDSNCFASLLLKNERELVTDKLYLIRKPKLLQLTK